VVSLSNHEPGAGESPFDRLRANGIGSRSC
jgi:hypothetical protein